ncbi:TetR/AcrR family transcriptional regulator [Dethiothermospora halolimnae]|uniref:TetR/AcrR family transcriptional regulator n=1 Tax=Dethiothermospora halolimnae TaxID=3114390 RepID=UPI003CCBFDC3
MKKENLNKRQLQAIETRKKIYDTAIKLMVKEGYDNITVSSICKSANVSVGSFYHHFKSKEGIIIEAYRIVDKYFESNVANKLKSKNNLDKIIEFVIYQVNYAKEMGIDLMIQVYKSQIQAGNRFFISNDRSLPSILRNIVVIGQSKGEITSSMTPQEITDFILRFSRGIIYDWCVHDGSYDIEKVAKDSMKKVINIFRP